MNPAGATMQRVWVNAPACPADAVGTAGTISTFDSAGDVAAALAVSTQSQAVAVPTARSVAAATDAEEARTAGADVAAGPRIPTGMNGTVATGEWSAASRSASGPAAPL